MEFVFVILFIVYIIVKERVLDKHEFAFDSILVILLSQKLNKKINKYKIKKIR